MIKNKKSVLVALIMVLLLGLLTACGGANDNGNSDGDTNGGDSSIETPVNGSTNDNVFSRAELEEIYQELTPLFENFEINISYEEMRDTYFEGVEGVYRTMGDTDAYDWFSNDTEFTVVSLFFDDFGGDYKESSGISGYFSDI